MKHIFLLFLVSTALLADFTIKVNVKDCKMYLLDNDKVVSEYNVATIKEGLPIPENGYITKVDLEPNWYPTQRTKDYFREHKNIILKDVVPYGDPQNYMGTFKITMTNSTASRGSVYRIHGNIDESKIGQRVTGGCVRMHNKEGYEFATYIKKIIKTNKVKVEYV